MTEQILETWLPLLVAALVQASFSLGVSMLTLLSGHLLSQEKSADRLERLSAAYVFGAFATILIGLAALTYLFSRTNLTHFATFWSVVIGVAFGIGLAVLLFYYRRGKNGTRLWLPRAAAEFLYARTRATRHSFEAFILGFASVITELIFIISPLIIAASVIPRLGSFGQVGAIFLYSIVAILPLIILWFANLRKSKISAFQKWRENNKKFLQIAAGVLLILLGFYLLIYKIM